jgi:uncharacterized protein YciI
MNYYVILYRCLPGQAARVMDEAGDHIRWVTQMIEQKVFLCAGPFINQDGQFDDGLCIIRANSKEEACRAVESDPFVQNGIRRYEIYHWDYHVDQDGYRIEFPPELKARWNLDSVTDASNSSTRG